MQDDNIDVNNLIEDVGNRLEKYLLFQEIEQPVMVGIHTGGVWVAEKLHQQLKLAEPLGTLDISFYRDDFTRIGLNPQVKPSSLPVAVENRHVILVDDVLHTGRTIRAAMNEIFDFGRPLSITLAALIERDQRELPICAQIVGKRMEFAPGKHIKLSNDGELKLSILSH
jgi:pyrimidine operon attenuation protein / uracil phosphoribosyltransferase